MTEHQYILNKEECVARGGHKYAWSVNQPVPTKRAPNIEVCKYCGHQRRGYYPPMIWEED